MAHEPPGEENRQGDARLVSATSPRLHQERVDLMGREGVADPVEARHDLEGEHAARYVGEHPGEEEERDELHRHKRSDEGFKDLPLHVHVEPEDEEGLAELWTADGPVFPKSPEVPCDGDGGEEAVDLSNGEADEPDVADSHLGEEARAHADAVQGQDEEELGESGDDDVDGVEEDAACLRLGADEVGGGRDRVQVGGDGRRVGSVQGSEGSRAVWRLVVEGPRCADDFLNIAVDGGISDRRVSGLVVGVCNGVGGIVGCGRGAVDGAGELRRRAHVDVDGSPVVSFAHRVLYRCGS